MSILKVDTINEKTSGNGVNIPGHVVQVVDSTNATFSPRFTTTSTSYVTTGHALTITPSSASNKILIAMNLSAHNSAAYIYGRIYRNSTALEHSDFAIGGGGYPWVMGGCYFLDSPSTTSQITYTLYSRVSGGTGYVGWSSSFGSASKNLNHWVLQEIAQ